MKFPFKMHVKSFIFLLLPFISTGNQVFADDLTWNGYPGFFGLFDPSKNMDESFCWQPEFKNTLTSSDNLIFHDGAYVFPEYKYVNSSKFSGVKQEVGSFTFKNFDNSYEIKISKNNAFSIYGEGIVNKGTAKHAFLIDETSALNFLNSASADESYPNTIEYYLANKSTLSFKNDSTAGTAIIQATAESLIEFADQATADQAKITVEKKSQLAFHNSSKAGKANILITGNSDLVLSDKSSCDEANIQIFAGSTLTVNNKNSIAALDADESSTIALGDNSLTLGNADTHDSHSLKGELHGNKASQLIKEGKGILTLNGGTTFKGKMVVKDGTLHLKQNLIGDLEVLSSKSVLEFQDNSGAGDNQICINQGKVLFKNKSSAESAHIIVENEGELAFFDDASGKDASVQLSKNAKLSIGQNNSLGSLHADSTSSISLNDYKLTLGELGIDDYIHGQLKGNSGSKLIKIGQGILQIHGDNKAFKGDMIIERGKVDFQGTLSGNVFVKKSCTLFFKNDSSAGTGNIKSSSESFIEFADNATAGQANILFEIESNISDSTEEIVSQIEKRNGSILFSQNSNAGKSQIKVSKANIVFRDTSQADSADIKIEKESQLAFQNSSKAGKANILISGESDLILSDESCCDQANVQILKQSTLTVKNHNSIGSLQIDDTSKAFLGDYSLTLGNTDKQDFIKGELHGSKDSHLIKEGKGILNLSVPYPTFIGKMVVKDGSIHLKQNLLGNLEVLNSNSCFEFHDISGAGYSEIHINQGKVLFKNKSSADSAHIFVAEEGELSFFDDASGKEASVQLSQNAKLSIGQPNSLGSIHADSASNISLNDYPLTVGMLGKDDFLHGKIKGNLDSKLVKTGKGSLQINGDKLSFKGDLNILMGNVGFQGDLGGSVTVEKSASMHVNGKSLIAKNLTLEEGSFLKLNCLETLQVSENYIQNENAEYWLNVNETGKSSRIDVDGAATIDKNIIIKVEGDYKLCDEYTILTATKGIVGGFQEAEELQELDSSFKTVKWKTYLSKKKKALMLIFQPNLAIHTKTSNQKKVAEQIDDIKKSDFNSSLKNLTALKNSHNICDALDHLSGCQYTNLVIANERSTDQFIKRIYAPLRFISTDHDCEELCFNQYKAWADIEGGKSFQSGAHGYDLTDYHFTVAVQRSVNDWLTECCPLSDYIPCSWLTGWTFGLAANYSIQDYQFKQDGDAHLNNIKGAFYGLMTKSMFYFLFDIVLGNTSGELTRHVAFGDFKEKGHGKIDLFQATFYGELGLNNIFYCDFGIQPFIGIEAGYYHLSDIKEHGGHAFDLEIDAQQKNLITSFLGTHLYHYMDERCSWGFAADIAWKHLFAYDNDLHQKFKNFGSKFEISGPKEDLNGIEARLVIFKEFNSLWSINAEFSGEKWANYSNFYLSAGVIFKW